MDTPLSDPTWHKQWEAKGPGSSTSPWLHRPKRLTIDCAERGVDSHTFR